MARPRMIWQLVLTTMSLLVCQPALAQQNQPAADSDANPAVRLWGGDAPGALGKDDVDIPTLTIFKAPADHNTGCAVVVCPGGGYHGLAEHEGKPIAQWLNSIGVNAFVLKYRLGPRYHHPAMMNDVNRAVRLTRWHATDWGIDPHRVGVLGFSAGGHLTSTAVTHFDPGIPDAADPVERFSSRPTFGVLVYPVITLVGDNAHVGSRRNLLGDDPSPELVDFLSSEKRVTADTPPCFLVHTSTDTVVPFENSLMFAEALRKHKVSVELHVFDHGAHGFGLGGNDAGLNQWPGLCAKWMGLHGWLGMAATRP
jgi:acetyl esterase/lipase